MLPYYLREPRYGDKKGTIRRRPVSQDGNPKAECGGPVQIAITNDLVDLRGKFREQLLEHTEQQAASSVHWKAGTAFLIFKDVFESSKMSMLHLLPPPRCDREAYSQLIYAACLALFMESFQKIVWKNIGEHFPEDNNDSDDNSNHCDDACFAIFSLFALFETNPLPRQIDDDNPLQLLPISLRSSEDPRTSYRRCFSQNIRIDRQHFAMLLRLKELALAKKCECERSFYERQKCNLEDSKCNERQNYSRIDTERVVSCNCSCGISIDVLEILERTFSRLELCEYTGPVGAEAFAGHAEYPHNNESITSKKSEHQMNGGTTPQQFKSQSLEGDGTYCIESSNDHSDEITSLIGTYHNSVTAIRIPASKSNAAKRLKGALEPLFSSINNERWDDAKKKSIHQAIDENDSYFQIERRPNKADDEADFGDPIPIPYDENQEQLESSIQKYEIILHDEIGYNLKKQLRASLIILLRRDEPIPPPPDFANRSSKSSLDTDDVSSIGYGGISVGTNQGGAAIHNLLSTVAGNIVSRKSRSKNTTKPGNKTANPNLANMFLTSNQAIDPVASSDEGSVDSEISILSLSDVEGTEEKDGISVATTAFGKKALEDLLQTVTQEEKNIDGDDSNHGNHGNHGNRKKQKAALKKTKKRKKTAIDSKPSSFKTKDGKEDDEISVATSAFGKRALEDLLQTAAEKEINIDRDDINRGNRNKQKAAPKKAKKRKKIAIDSKPSSFKTKDGKEDDEISVATSAFGKRALEDLLQTATQEEINIDGDNNIDPGSMNEQKAVPKKAKRRKKTVVDCKLGSLKNKDSKDDDEISIATSACGKKALDDLLQTVAKD